MVIIGNGKIWDYLSKTSVQTLEEHKFNISYAVYRLMLPIIVTSSDGRAV